MAKVLFFFPNEEQLMKAKKWFGGDGESEFMYDDESWSECSLTFEEGNNPDVLAEAICEELEAEGFTGYTWKVEKPATIEVTFQKKVNGIGERERYELETFTVEVDGTKSAWEQSCDAYSEAVRRGHNPHKNIRMHWIEGAPTTPDGEPYDVEITTTNCTN